MSKDTRLFIGIVAITTFLVACGGGGGGDNSSSPPGGGGNPPPTQTTGTITSVSNAEIPLGASSGQSMVVWTSNATQPGDVRLRVNGAEVSTQPTSPQGGFAAQVASGEVKVELVTASGQVLDTKTATASCAMGVWRNGVCDKFRYPRFDLVIESLPLNPGDVPILVLKDGKATRLINRTGYEVKPGAGIPLAQTFIYDTVREDGAPLIGAATIETGNQVRTFPINPETNELMPEYTGPLPVGAKAIGGIADTQIDSTYSQYDVVYTGMYIEVPGYGIYYFTGTDQREVRLTRDNFASYSVVMTSQLLRVLHTFVGK
jgi:hypothetical protein